ncbi:MAG: hypothetical protein MJE68_22860 [Proteobacteria bacterium]|nr:hypothetical protein [Pseudomonadota bacterium]
MTIATALARRMVKARSNTRAKDAKWKPPRLAGRAADSINPPRGMTGTQGPFLPNNAMSMGIAENEADGKMIYSGGRGKLTLATIATLATINK